MKLGIMQPYLFPYIGYFQLINAVDRFVIYDDVNYIKGGWINRNKILVDNREYIFTVILDHASAFKHINKILIKDDFVDLQKTLYFSYHKAPHFKQVNSLLENVFSSSEKQLGEFIANSIGIITAYLGIDTELIVSSRLKKNNTLKNKDKVIHICKLLGASQYINAIGGQKLYNKKEFAANNIELNFIKSHDIQYKQFNNEFVPWLSIIDVMMFNSKGKIKELLGQYELI